MGWTGGYIEVSVVTANGDTSCKLCRTCVPKKTNVKLSALLEYIAAGARHRSLSSSAQMTIYPPTS